MYNEIKLLVEKVFTIERYMLNMKHKTPDIVDFVLRNSLKEDIGNPSTIMSSSSDNKYNIIISLIDIDKAVYFDKYIMYKGKPTILIGIPKAIRDDDYSAKKKISRVYYTVLKLIELLITDNIAINNKTASMIITMDILMSLYNESQYILEYFIEQEEYDDVYIREIYKYILENNNSTLSLLDEYDIYRINK